MVRKGLDSVGLALGLVAVLIGSSIGGQGATLDGTELVDQTDSTWIAIWPDHEALQHSLSQTDVVGVRLTQLPIMIIDDEAANELAASDTTVRLEQAEKIVPFLETATTASRAAHVWGPAGGGPITTSGGDVIDGSGVGIAVIDIGIDARHESIAEATVLNFLVVAPPHLEFLDTEPDLYGGALVPTPTSRPQGFSHIDHGTHVASIAVGRATENGAPGAAPGASLYGFGVNVCVINANCLSNTGALLVAMDAAIWLSDLVEPHIRVISISMGQLGPFDADHPAAMLTSKAIEAGLVVVWAAGNGGGDGSEDMTNKYAKHPAAGVLSVANYNDHNGGGRDHGLAAGSSRGAAADASTWPDLSAPGTTIRAAQGLGYPNGLLALGSSGYTNITGTSMAAPHVSGVAALMLQANPDLAPAEVERLLEATAYEFGAGYVADPAHPSGKGSFDKGHGLVDAQAAVLAALAEG